MKIFYSIVTILVVFALFSFTTGCKENSGEPRLDPKLDKLLVTFFDKYKKASSEAVDYIFDTNKEFSKEQISELKMNLETTQSMVGKYHGNERITIQKTSDSFVYVSYLVKHDKPIRFIFLFYKPSGSWQLYKFKYDDQVDEELEESGKVYFLK